MAPREETKRAGEEESGAPQNPPQPASNGRPHGAAVAFETWQVHLHGHEVMYRTVGEGPPVVLIHGMVNSSRHWEQVALRLAEHHRVVAPDLIGHGDSATPRGDYSLGAHAAAIRDLLAVIGVDGATIVGHSLGGGVAMQYIYQFPDRVQRLVLISSGGLGHEVSPLLRTAALPGVSAALALGANRRVADALRRVGTGLRERNVPQGVYLEAIARALRPLERAGARQAFLQTLRAVIDMRGQRVNAQDRLHMLSGPKPIPTLIMWGERDRTIPLEHGRNAHRAIPHSRFVTLERAAHFPHLEDPLGVASALARFIAETEPAQLSESDWTGRLAPEARPLRID
ncbi:MAG: alpha/beta fold hydrolase [Solirubrobacteraceae bacterium]